LAGAIECYQHNRFDKTGTITATQGQAIASEGEALSETEMVDRGCCCHSIHPLSRWSKNLHNQWSSVESPEEIEGKGF
jgi:Cu+-exporting ATPase